jgi:hypothetical protein
MLTGWSLLPVILAIIAVAIVSVSRAAVHTQKHLAAMNDSDPVIDALVWINRHTSRRPR